MALALTVAQLVAATGGTRYGDAEPVATSISTDTRTLEPGAAFVALRGENFDGHTFLTQATEKGAVLFVVDRALAFSETSLPQIVVPDTTRALGAIARLVRNRFSGPVVGITGSVGKTTVKELTAAVLAAQYATVKSEANHNNEIGVPQTILGMPETAGALVLEMGMRGKGQIAHLAAVAAPTIGVVTGVGLSHIELLGSRAAIADAKAELLEALPENGTAIFPATDDFAAVLRAKTSARVLTVAIDAPADIRASELAHHENGWRATISTPWGVQKIFVPSPGRFNVQNALLALAVGGALEIPLDAIARALLRFTPPPMRLETVTGSSGARILSDAYNAAPDSMIGALQTLMETPVGARGARIAVLGEMRELGTFAPEAHRMVGRVVAKLRPQMLVLIGTATKDLSAAAIAAGYSVDHVHYFDTTAQAAEAIPLIVGADDAVLVKGSRALALEQLVRALGAMP
jgi:UDP-N-acetylmuramoyl-tripeptide--D-alanyl-D-alanine ligase